jgi:hypothetical protein
MTTCIAPGPTDLARYTSLRARLREFNARLVRTIPRHVLGEIGAALGLRSRDTLCFRSESEIAVLMDSCLFEWTEDGRNIVERYAQGHASIVTDDEHELLAIMRRARYTVVAVETVVPGLGLWAFDLHEGERIFIMDVGLSHTAAKSWLLASRLFPLSGYWMTSGAALPIGCSPAERFEGMGPGLKEALTTPAGRLGVVRACLERGCAEYVAYDEHTLAPRRSRTSPRIGRNAACTCGSGKKFKRCCGSAR